MKSGDITQRLATAERPHLSLGVEEYKGKWCSQSPCFLATRTNGVSTRTAVSITTSASLQEARSTHSRYTAGPGECEVTCKCCCLWSDPGAQESCLCWRHHSNQKENGSPLPSSKCLPSSSPIDRN